jgi:hypothetical protein
MRVVLFTIVLTLNSIAVKAQSEWNRVYTFDESMIEMNTSLVTSISKDVSRVRFRWTFNEPQSLSGTPVTRYQSQLEVMEVNCSLKRFRRYHLTFFDAAGTIVRINDSPGEWRRAPIGSMTEKLFASGCELIEKKTRPAHSAEENLQLQKVASFAHAFAHDLERKKDFKPLIDRFFVSDYLAGYLQDQDTNLFMNLDRDVASKLSRQELQRFYVAQMNAGYLSSLYLISQLKSEDEASAQNLLPLDVRQLIKNHDLGERIDTVERMQSYTDLLERISSLMRVHVRRTRATQSEEWQTMQSYWSLYQPVVNVCTTNCLGLPAGTTLFEVNVPVFRLKMAEIGGNLKVVSAISRF